MKLLDFFSKLTLFFVFALGGVYLGLRVLNSGAFESSTRDDFEQAQTDSQGVVLSSLIDKKLNGDLLIMAKGTTSTKIISYKLSSKSQRLVAEFQTDEELLVESKMSQLYIFFRSFENHHKLFRIDKIEPNAKVLEVADFEIGSEEKYFDLRVDQGANVYLSSFETAGEEGFVSRVRRLSENGEVQIISEYEDSDIWHLDKVREYQEEDLETANGQQIILRKYSIGYGDLGECINYETQELVDCELENEYYSIFPTKDGYEIDQSAKIFRSVNKENKEVVLEGKTGEYFASINKYEDSVYFIAGKLESDGEKKFGEFVPISLQEYGLDSEQRETLVTLPSNTYAEIKGITEQYILMTLVEELTGEILEQEQSIWLYTFEDGEFRRIKDIDCGVQVVCNLDIIN